MSDYYERSKILHEQLRGKISVHNKLPIGSRDDLSLAYTPGVAKPCELISEDPDSAYKLTVKGNSVAVITDGSAVLGLGDIGPLAALPVMEGKALLFREFGKIDAWPICVDTNDPKKIIETCRLIAPSFGGINLEDISAPRCFEIEEKLQDLGIPVFHDDQHGTAIVLLAALINSSKVTSQSLDTMSVIINGSGAAGIAIAKLISGVSSESQELQAVADVIVCDSKGAISSDRTDLNTEKQKLLEFTNKNNISGSVKEVINGANVFIGVSKGNVISAEDVKTMAQDPIILAMANPTPEIMPDEAKKGGALVIGTGRSDFPNQVNNVLVFPGIFRGALDARSPVINNAMKLAAAKALAESVPNNELSTDKILPHPLDRTVAPMIAKAVRVAARVR
ncbi:MAG: NAD-dependent malic enzyme [Rhodospirillaceae bacterium]|nr:NAD-dependent malic enzyme [Rhodospirillaceae bacterium]OUT80312.1 MAG: NAD-dependent malic enzyme [Rhodospirillaceae bacterium TMED23]|tara:strand:+ start:3782 stop:4963 length:1182 start_codon:yes stop_codon:yes gene_type:complete